MIALQKIASMGVLLKLISSFVTYIFIGSMAVFLSIEDFGFVSLLISSSLFFSVIGCVGQRLALLKFIPGLKFDEETIVFINSFRIAIFGNFLIYFVLFFTFEVFILKPDYSPEIYQLTLILLIVPFTGVLDMVSHYLRAKGKIVYSIFPKDIFWKALVTLILTICFIRGDYEKLTLDTAMYALIIPLVTIVFAFLYVFCWDKILYFFRKKSLYSDFRTSCIERKEYTIPFWLSSVSNVAFSNLDVILVGVVLGVDSAGVYFIANRVALIFTVFEQATNMVLGPMISLGINDITFRSKAVKMCRYLAMIVVVIYFMLVIFGHKVLSFLGAVYSEAYILMFIIITARAFAFTLGPSESFLVLGEKQHTAMKISIVTLIFSLPFIYFSTLYFGQIGAASSVAFVIFFKRLLFWLFAHKTLNIRTDIYPRYI